MINAKKNFFVSFLTFALCALLAFVVLGGFGLSAQAAVGDTVYCDDIFEGTGEQISATYSIYCDDYKMSDSAAHPYAPSFGTNDNTMKNACGPLTGMNIVTFYDRWYTNLVPNYTPGIINSKGNYQYIPDMAGNATQTCIKSLYSLMKTGELGGTTSANFKSGLKKYVQDAGYDISSSSIYSNSLTVNLSKLKTAISQNKIGIIMLRKFNYVSKILDLMEESRVQVTKINMDAGHMMMVYGFMTLDFYKNGEIICTETFLNVTSSDSSAEVGFIQVNDYLDIEEALIYTIS